MTNIYNNVYNIVMLTCIPIICGIMLNDAYHHADYFVMGGTVSIFVLWLIKCDETRHLKQILRTAVDYLYAVDARISNMLGEVSDYKGVIKKSEENPGRKSPKKIAKKKSEELSLPPPVKGGGAP